MIRKLIFLSAFLNVGITANSCFAMENNLNNFNFKLEQFENDALFQKINSPIQQSISHQNNTLGTLLAKGKSFLLPTFKQHELIERRLREGLYREINIHEYNEFDFMQFKKEHDEIEKKHQQYNQMHEQELQPSLEDKYNKDLFSTALFVKLKKMEEKRQRRLARETVPDDMVPSGTWKTIFNLGKNSPETDGAVRRKDIYIPHNIDFATKVVVAMIILHGTWGTKTKDYYSDTSSKYQNFRHLKRFAAWYAVQHKKRLILESYQWSGDFREEKRGNASYLLSEHINNDYANDHVVLISHSHGGNVIIIYYINQLIYLFILLVQFAKIQK